MITVSSFHQNCPQLRKALARLSECSKDLALRLLRCISLCLDQDLDFMDNIHLGMMMEGTEEGQVENCTTLRSIHYPPISDKMAKDPKIIRKGVILATNVPLTCLCFISGVGNTRITGPSPCCTRTSWAGWR